MTAKITSGKELYTV